MPSRMPRSATPSRSAGQMSRIDSRIAHPATTRSARSGPMHGSVRRSSMFITDKRKEQVNFTDTLYMQPEGMIVPAGSTLASKEDVKGKVIGAQTGTLGQQGIERQQAALAVGDRGHDSALREDRTLRAEDAAGNGGDHVAAGSREAPQQLVASGADSLHLDGRSLLRLDEPVSPVAADLAALALRSST